MFRARAKINFGLLVLGMRADGYHDILTIFHRIDWHDDITFGPSRDISVVSSSPDAPDGEMNICHTAASSLREALGISEGVRIHIEKRIPVGAGLGGGSSDAAAVLRELPAYWKAEASPELLHRLALEIGSDVPYFMGKGSACGSGRGEVLDYFHLDVPFAILTCSPGVRISTAWAYGRLAGSPRSAAVDLRRAVVEGLHDPTLLAEMVRNDFEPAVFEEYPEIRTLKETLISRGAVFASMSGSGSAVFGLFTGEETARAAAANLAGNGFAVSVTPPHFQAG